MIVIIFLPEVPAASGLGMYTHAHRCSERSVTCPRRSVSSSPVLVLLCHSRQGEICLCTSRIFVQKRIYSEFLKRFVAATRMWKVGIPSDPSASMGALISKAHLEKVSASLLCPLQKVLAWREAPCKHSTGLCFEVLSATTLLLNNYDLRGIVSGYRVSKCWL